MIAAKIYIEMSRQESKRTKDTQSKIIWELKAAISPGRSYNIAEVEAWEDRSARLGSAQLVNHVVNSWIKKGWKVNHGLQVIITDSFESVVAMEIIAADVICQVGCTDPSERHRVQLGLSGTINSLISAWHAMMYWNVHRRQFILSYLFVLCGISEHKALKNK